MRGDCHRHSGSSKLIVVTHVALAGTHIISSRFIDGAYDDKSLRAAASVKQKRLRETLNHVSIKSSEATEGLRFVAE